MPVHALDKFYLAVTLLVTIAYQLLGFFIAYALQFDKITDFTGASNLFILALLTILLSHSDDRPHARNLIAFAFTALWALRLALWQAFRMYTRGSDKRFDSIRSRFFPYLGFWTFQILWVWTISIPLTVLNSPAVTGTPVTWARGHPLDIIGVVFMGLGFGLETAADGDKHIWGRMSGAKDRPCDFRLWYLSRHPNYFGEMLFWWGMWFVTLTPAISGGLPGSVRAAEFAAVVSPLFTMFLLLFISGLPTSEIPSAKKFYALSHPTNGPPAYPNAYANYLAYRARTSPLIPIPPAMWVRFPGWLKWVLGEWKMWEWVPEGEEERAEGGGVMPREE